MLLELLDDLAAGASSALEREYLHLERSHGLPTGTTAGRQSRDRIDGSSVYRDARRDLVTLAVRDAATVRLTHGLVLRCWSGVVEPAAAGAGAEVGRA